MIGVSVRVAAISRMAQLLNHGRTLRLWAMTAAPRLSYRWKSSSSSPRLVSVETGKLAMQARGSAVAELGTGIYE